jgi:FlaA1/EpsC-like NDP-sugar epimerase
VEKVLITGASGFLGRNLAARLASTHEVLLTSRNQKNLIKAAHALKMEAAPMDVSDLRSTREIFQRFKPDLVIHAAATKFVDISEKYPNECIDINVVGSQNVARTAMETGVRFVLGISTDKASPPMANIYGLSKAVMEKLFVSLNDTTATQFACVRYGNVAWSTGSVFPIWKRMIEEGNHIVTTGPNMSRFFFPINDAVDLIMAALNNRELVAGKLLSMPMKGVVVQRILDLWTKKVGATWSIGEMRPGDRDLEYLIASTEAPFTEDITLQGKSYFLMNRGPIPLPHHIPGEFSSRSANQFTDQEIENIVFDKSIIELW